MPHAKTVWLYREGLAQAGMVEALFTQFDGHLARQCYIARGGQILDTSIVQVARNHNTRDDSEPVNATGSSQRANAINDGEVPEDLADEPAKRSNKDVDGR